MQAARASQPHGPHLRPLAPEEKRVSVCIHPFHAQESLRKTGILLDPSQSQGAPRRCLWLGNARSLPNFAFEHLRFPDFTFYLVHLLGFTLFFTIIVIPISSLYLNPSHFSLILLRN